MPASSVRVILPPRSGVLLLTGVQARAALWPLGLDEDDASPVDLVKRPGAIDRFALMLGA